MSVLQYFVATLDEVEEQYRGLYEESEGRYELKGVDVRSFPDIARMNDSMRKEREDHKETKRKWAEFGMTPDELRERLNRQEEDALSAKDGADIESKIRLRLGPVERERDTNKRLLDEALAKIEQFEAQSRTRMVHDAIREAVGKTQGFQPSAVEDALMFAERMFEVTEEGHVITKDRVGVTPGISPSVWLVEMQSRKSHWWGPTQGGGAVSGKNGIGVGSNPWVTGNLTEQGRIFREDRAKAEQLASLAGKKLF